jgi:DNA-binding response OmpR family regulator
MVNTSTRDAHVLLVEDDAGLATMVSEALQVRGYSVWHAQSAVQAEVAVDQLRPDVIVLDLMLPDGNGLTLCSKLKERARSPVVICSATRRKDDAVLGFQLGADDFLRKPFSVDELQARIDLALRRGYQDSSASASATDIRQIGNVHVDARRCEATSHGQTLRLTPTEFRLLSALAGRAPDVVARPDLAQPIWGTVDEDVIRTLDVHMRRLRAKLTAHATGVRLVARRGFGYQLLHDAA